MVMEEKREAEMSAATTEHLSMEFDGKDRDGD